MLSPALDQRAFRGRNDDGTQTTATWKATANTNWNQVPGERFRLRFLIRETNGVSLSGNNYLKLQYSRNGGTWTDVNSTSVVARPDASPNVAEAEATTQQLGTGTFSGGRIDEVDGTFANTLAHAGNDETEWEFSLVIRQADTVVGDTISFRVIYQGGTVLSSYTATPTVTLTGKNVVDAAQRTGAAATTLTGAASGYPPQAKWGTETDWNNRASQLRVVHEATANTDYTNAGVVQQGTGADPFPGGVQPYFFAPLHEDAGTTVYDVSGNARNGTAIGGPTPGQPGVLGTTAWSFDGVDDGLEFDAAHGILDPVPEFTVMQYLYRPATTASDGTNMPPVARGGSGDSLDFLNVQVSRTGAFAPEAHQVRARVYDDSVSSNYTLECISPPIPTDQWIGIVIRKYWDGVQSTLEIHFSNALQASATDPNQLTGQAATTSPFRIGTDGYGTRFWRGRIGPTYVYHTALPDAVISEFMTTGPQPGEIITAEKII